MADSNRTGPLSGLSSNRRGKGPWTVKDLADLLHCRETLRFNFDVCGEHIKCSKETARRYYLRYLSKDTAERRKAKEYNDKNSRSDSNNNGLARTATMEELLNFYEWALSTGDSPNDNDSIKFSATHDKATHVNKSDVAYTMPGNATRTNMLPHKVVLKTTVYQGMRDNQDLRSHAQGFMDGFMAAHGSWNQTKAIIALGDALDEKIGCRTFDIGVFTEGMIRLIGVLVTRGENVTIVDDLVYEDTDADEKETGETEFNGDSMEHGDPMELDKWAEAGNVDDKAELGGD